MARFSWLFVGLPLAVLVSAAAPNPEFSLIATRKLTVPKELRTTAKTSLKISIIGFPETYNEGRLLREIKFFNKTYLKCDVQIASKIPVKIYAHPGSDLTFHADAVYFVDEPENRKWGALMKESMFDGLPIILLQGTYDEPWNGLSLLAITINFFDPESTAKDSSLFPPYGFVMTNLARGNLATRGDDNLDIFSHEMGHVLFNSLSHHRSRSNLMNSDPFATEPRGNDLDAETQCPKAKRFSRIYNRSLHEFQKLTN